MKKKKILGKICVIATCALGCAYVMKNKDEIRYHLSNKESI